MSASRNTYKITGRSIGLIFFGTLPPVVLGLLVKAIYPQPIWMFLAGFAVLWFSMATYGFIQEITVTPREVEEAQNIEKLQALVDSGKPLVYESHVILDDADRRALTKSFFRPVPALVIFALVPILIGMFISYWIMLISLAPIALAIAAWISVGTMKKRNRKVILRGIITARPYYRAKEHGDSQHFITIGDRRLAVEGNFYDEYIVGDIIELHYVGWLRNGEMSSTGSVFTQHRKMTPNEFTAWVKEFTGGPISQ